MVWKDLEITRKASKSYYLVFKRKSAWVDITGWTIYFTLKKQMKDPDTSALIKKDVTTHLDAKHGKTAIVLTPIDTDIDEGNYYYDIVVKDEEGNVLPLYRGRMRMIEPVTQRS